VKTTKRGSARLAPEDWTDEGLRIIGEEGLPALTIARAALRLGVTKGSFYWHFADRDAYLRATLERWIFLSTVGTEAQVAGLQAPRAKLARLFEIVVGSGDPVRLDTAIWAGRADPVVASYVAEASRRRLAILARLYQEIGLSAGEAADWALSAYAAFVGLLGLGELVTSAFRARDRRGRYAQHLVRLHTPPRARGAEARAAAPRARRR
jgi:AcrR family transcriptional regulator